MKVSITICDEQKHELEKYEPELTGFGTNDVAMLSRCKKCDCMIQYYYTPKSYIYEVRINNFQDDNVILRIERKFVKVK